MCGGDCSPSSWPLTAINSLFHPASMTIVSRPVKKWLYPVSITNQCEWKRLTAYIQNGGSDHLCPEWIQLSHRFQHFYSFTSIQTTPKSTPTNSKIFTRLQMLPWRLRVSPLLLGTAVDRTESGENELDESGAAMTLRKWGSGAWTVPQS